MAPTIGPAAKHKLDHDDGREREESADRIDHASRPALGGPFGPGTAVTVSVVVMMFSEQAAVVGFCGAGFDAGGRT